MLKLWPWRKKPPKEPPVNPDPNDPPVPASLFGALALSQYRMDKAVGITRVRPIVELLLINYQKAKERELNAVKLRLTLADLQGRAKTFAAAAVTGDLDAQSALAEIEAIKSQIEAINQELDGIEQAEPVLEE